MARVESLTYYRSSGRDQTQEGNSPPEIGDLMTESAKSKLHLMMTPLVVPVIPLSILFMRWRPSRFTRAEEWWLNLGGKLSLPVGVDDADQ